MTINQILHQKTREELEAMREFWIPGASSYKSTAALIRSLAQRMRNANLVVRMYEELCEKEQDILRVLLKTEGYTDTVSAVVGRSSLGRQPKAASRILFSLEWKGLINLFSPNGAWRGRRSEATIPMEIARTLHKYIILEGRPLKALLSLREYLEVIEVTSEGGDASKPPLNDLDEQVDEPDQSQIFERLMTFADIEKRIDTIEDEQLKKAIYLALNQYCGLLSLSRLNAELRSAVADKKDQWQETLEERFIGTINKISLLNHDIALDGEHLIIFQEVVETYLRGISISEDRFDRVDSAGLDFVTDISVIINFVANNETKLTQTGALYKNAAKKIQALIIQKPNAAVNESMLLNLKTSACFKLGLLAADVDNRVEMTEKAVQWERLDLAAKLKKVFNAFQLCKASALPGRRSNPLRKIAFDVMKTLEVNRWYPRLSISYLSMCRHLLELPDEVSVRNAANRFHSNMGVFRLFTMSVEEMCSDLSDHISPLMASLGMLDLATRGKSASAIRLTEIGAWILGLSEPTAQFELPQDDKEGEEAKEKLLIVNPDFEVLLFPGEDYFQLSYQLSRFCRREKSDQIVHFKITKEGIETAALNSITPDVILAVLERNSQNPIPQNVGYSIREWGGKIQLATTSTVQLLETQDAEAMTKALSLHEIQNILVRQLSPTAIVVSREPRYQKAIDALREAGVYLR